VTDVPQDGDPAPGHDEAATPTDHVGDALGDTSGVADWVEEGGPLEPQDVAAVEGAGAEAGADDTSPEADELTVTTIALEERTLDLQRLQAEYLNYKRRVERDRDLVKQNATYSALAPITEVLDTIDRARESAATQGAELSDDLKTVAEQLERTVSTLGLVKFGEPGDAFDPTIHEALSHIGEDADVSVTTCKVVAKAGYKIGERVVRAAQVLVVDPVE